VDEELDELLASLAAVAVEGAKGVGKTATASLRADEVFRLDDDAMRQVVAAHPAVLDRPGTVLIDEWQRHPPVWDYVRRRVDDGARPGSFLLTGSAVPADAPAHSGAGRIVQLRMRPLSLAERDLSPCTVSLGQLLRGDHPGIAGQSEIGLAGYVDEIVVSGFPGIRPLDPRARRAQLDGYVQRVVQRDFPEQGLRVRRPDALRGWLTAYAAATATTASYNSILDAATAGESHKPTKTTVIAYRDVLAQLWLVEPLPGWTPGRGHLHRLTQAPKHHLADPGLAAHLVGVDAGALLAGASPGVAVPRDGTFLGALFESLVTLSVRVYAQRNEAAVRHMRTRDGRQEVDLIIARRDQRVVALEVKLASTVEAGDVRHLLWLREQLGADLLDAAVITTGEHAYRRDDGIAVIPASLLGP
ncbi:MAG: ATP-binding protein, partial [Acidimicrobiales bacterium]